jgi:hypothetical protein
MFGVRSVLWCFVDTHGMDPDAGGETAAVWWARLRRWEQDEVEAWWRDQSLPFPLSAGLKQAHSGLDPSGDPGETMTTVTLAFLTTHFMS